MGLQFPDETEASRLGFCPSPANDGGAPELQRVFSARKYMALVDEILSLNQEVWYPVFNATGSAIKAGPVCILGCHAGTGYLVNGAALQGAATMLVDTGTDIIAIGSLFTIAGVEKDLNGGLQVFTATSARTGAGSLDFTPPLPENAADNAAITVNRGFRVAPASNLFVAELLVLEQLTVGAWGIGVKQGSFQTALLDTSGAAPDDPVYIDSAGAMTLTAPNPALMRVQRIGFVQTLANPGKVNGVIIHPYTLGQAQLGKGAILGIDVGDSTTLPFVPPRMTSAQKTSIASPISGMVVFDTDLQRLEVYASSAWGPPGIADTLTNKRIVPRVTTITSSATPTINTDACDCVTITALAAAITSMTSGLTGTPNNFEKLIFRIKDNGTARAISWGSSFAAAGVALPTTTVISKLLTVGFIYNSVISKWGCVASAQEA